MAEIQLTKGKVALVDDIDFARFSEMMWHCCVGYAANSSREYMHRLVLGLEKGDRRQGDHINGNPLDNRRSNLRICVPRENLRNRGPQRNGKSGFKGVSRHSQTGKWVAMIGFDGKQAYLGSFDTKEDAARAYNEAAKERFGPFAWLNEVS